MSVKIGVLYCDMYDVTEIYKSSTDTDDFGVRLFNYCEELKAKTHMDWFVTRVIDLDEVKEI